MNGIELLFSKFKKKEINDIKSESTLEEDKIINNEVKTQYIKETTENNKSGSILSQKKIDVLVSEMLDESNNDVKKLVKKVNS